MGLPGTATDGWLLALWTMAPSSVNPSKVGVVTASRVRRWKVERWAIAEADNGRVRVLARVRRLLMQLDALAEAGDLERCRALLRQVKELLELPEDSAVHQRLRKRDEE